MITRPPTSTAPSKELIREFCLSPTLRIAVTVDMIATGTDIKPLEVLIFLGDVRSRVYFEQMKGRGTRVLSSTDLQSVSGEDARAKTRFVIVDAVGVCESDKTESRPLDRQPTVPLKTLLQLIATQEGIPAMIPAEACYLGWQESLVLLAKLVEAEIPDQP